MRRTLTGTLALICVMLTAIICCSIAAFVLKLDNPFEQTTFSIEGWNSSGYGPDGTFSRTRYLMVNDLLKRYDFHGWSIAQVKQLLGEPLERQPWQPTDWVDYDLYAGYNVLKFQVDEQQRVIRYYVHHDD